MNNKYKIFEQYILKFMQDYAHDREHIHRVVNLCLEIAKYETNVDYDILICSAFLHDIGRKFQFENPKICHAEVGSKIAYQFLIENSYSTDFAEKVIHCILTHRFRNDNPPKSIEAKILFDADTIDVTGLVGIARTLMYKGKVNDPLYVRNIDNKISCGDLDGEVSFFQEYKKKLENIYDKFYTKRGLEIAKTRQKSSILFYEKLLEELSEFS